MARPWRVMVIDDSFDAAFDISRAFVKEGFTAEVFVNRDAAAVALPEIKPDLIVMDYIAPGVSAEIFLSLCRDRCPETKVLLIAESDSAWSAAEKLNVHAMYHQPILPEVLVSHAVKIVAGII